MSYRIRLCAGLRGHLPDAGTCGEAKTDLSWKTGHCHGRLCPEADHFSREETLVVGDRLYTDIPCGHNAGVETALVLTGEATREEAEACDYGPDYIFSSIAELYREWM